MLPWASSPEWVRDGTVLATLRRGRDRTAGLPPWEEASQVMVRVVRLPLGVWKCARLMPVAYPAFQRASRLSAAARCRSLADASDPSIGVPLSPLAPSALDSPAPWWPFASDLESGPAGGSLRTITSRGRAAPERSAFQAALHDDRWPGGVHPCCHGWNQVGGASWNALLEHHLGTAGDPLGTSPPVCVSRTERGHERRSAGGCAGDGGPPTFGRNSVDPHRRRHRGVRFRCRFRRTVCRSGCMSGCRSTLTTADSADRSAFQEDFDSAPKRFVEILPVGHVPIGHRTRASEVQLVVSQHPSVAWQLRSCVGDESLRHEWRVGRCLRSALLPGRRSAWFEHTVQQCSLRGFTSESQKPTVHLHRAGCPRTRPLPGRRSARTGASPGGEPPREACFLHGVWTPWCQSALLAAHRGLRAVPSSRSWLWCRSTQAWGRLLGVCPRTRPLTERRSARVGASPGGGSPSGRFRTSVPERVGTAASVRRSLSDT